MGDNFDKKADRLAVDIEESITISREFLEQLPKFKERSQRSTKLERVLHQNNE